MVDLLTETSNKSVLSYFVVWVELIPRDKHGGFPQCSRDQYQRIAFQRWQWIHQQPRYLCLEPQCCGQWYEAPLEGLEMGS
jgi:hypothetical protein